MNNNLDNLEQKNSNEIMENSGVENIDTLPEDKSNTDISPEEKQAEIADLKTQNEQTMKELSEAREGIPENENQDELPQSVLENNEKIQKLNEKVDEDSQEKKEEEFKIERLQAGKFAETAQKLVNVFRKRQTKGFNSVLSEGELGRLSSGVAKIKDVISKKEYDQDELDQELIKVGVAISMIGENLPPQRSVSDEPKNLKALMFNLKNTGEECRSLVLSLSKFPAEQTEKTRKILHKIVENTDKKRMFLARKTEALMRMMGR